MKIAVFKSPADLVPFRGEDAFREAIANDSKLRDVVEFAIPDDAVRMTILREAEIVIVARMPYEMIDAARNLRWASFWTSGLDPEALPHLAARKILVTNSSGVHAPKIAAHLMACILMFACRMPFFQRAQAERAWKQENDGYDDLTGKTLGIAGLGRIGEALALRARQFGMRVVATKRDVTTRHDPSITIDKLYGPDQLPEMLSACDHVCLTMHYTPETHHLFDAGMLSHMKQTAYFYNTARGRIVDEIALAEALKSGAIAGAGLDVFETEPLSLSSPLWAMENVIITPHVAGFNPHYFTRAARIFTDNLRRFLDSQPLINLYDPNRGY